MIPQLFLGQRNTANVLKVDVEGEDDAGEEFTKLARTNRYAPGEEAVFSKAYVSATWSEGPIFILMTPYVDQRVGVEDPVTDGEHILAQILELPMVEELTTKEFEVPIVEVHRQAGAEQTRAYPRGKWIRLEFSWTSLDGCQIDGVDIEQEVLRESLTYANPADE